MKKISWLDSGGVQYSSIHISADEGESTLCGYPPMRNHRSKIWQIAQAPKRKQGQSNRCKTCFSKAHQAGNKSVKDWFSAPSQTLLQD